MPGVLIAGRIISSHLHRNYIGKMVSILNPSRDYSGAKLVKVTK